VNVVILQPFYLPYSGVFELVRMADVFVFYDDVKMSRQSWQCRNQIKTSQGPHWLTVPLIGSNESTIQQTLLNEDGAWRRKHRSAVEQAYAKAPYSSLLLDALGEHWSHPWPDLAALNIATFTSLCEVIGVSAQFLRSSEMTVPGSSSQRVLDMCKSLGATRYITGPTARSYLDEGSFDDAGIELCYHQFDHPRYPQLHGDFVPYMSVVDLIANTGPDAASIIAGHGQAVPAGEFVDEL
jgi:hypothetical protein